MIDFSDYRVSTLFHSKDIDEVVNASASFPINTPSTLEARVNAKARKVLRKIDPQLRHLVQSRFAFVNKEGVTLAEKIAKLNDRCDSKHIYLRKNTYFSINNDDCTILISHPSKANRLLVVGNFSISKREASAYIDSIIPNKGTNLSGQEILSYILSILYELGIESCRLNDASAIHCPKKDGKWSLRLWHVFATGQGWYESRGFHFIGYKEVPQKRYRQACREIYKLKIADLEHILQELRPKLLDKLYRSCTYYLSIKKKQNTNLQDKRVSKLFKLAKAHLTLLPKDSNAHKMYHYLSSCCLLFPDTSRQELRSQSENANPYYHFTKSKVAQVLKKADKKAYSELTKRFLQNYHIVNNSIDFVCAL
ncbi:MAG: hypothetical protein GWP59_07880 [Chlamydiales bacterium]|nr:hypothetical protein [Chlamydiales bacterium]NCF71604.1 hypothetical protein [Chlamydiales bacterium]